MSEDFLGVGVGVGVEVGVGVAVGMVLGVASEKGGGGTQNLRMLQLALSMADSCALVLPFI